MRAEYLEDRSVKQDQRATRKLLALLQTHHKEPDPPPPPKVIPIVTHGEVAESIDVCVLPIENAPLSIDGIKRVVCRHLNLSHTEIISDRREQKVVYPRQIAMYLCREKTPFSLPQIGKRFGGRDHTTVLHAVNKIAGLLKQDWKVAHDVAQIEAQL